MVSKVGWVLIGVAVGIVAAMMGIGAFIYLERPPWVTALWKRATSRSTTNGAQTRHHMNDLEAGKSQRNHGNIAR